MSKYCKKCGKELKEDGQYCEECKITGDVDRSNNNSNIQENSKKNNNVGIIVVLSILLLVLFIGVPLYYINKQEQERIDKMLGRDKETSTKQEIPDDRSYYAGRMENYDCSLENVSYADTQFVVSNGVLYLIESKKNTETDTHCKPIYKNENNYKFIGMMSTAKDGTYFIYQDNNKILGVDRFGTISDYKLRDYVDIEELIKTKSISHIYYTNTYNKYYYYVTDNSIYYYQEEQPGKRYESEVVIPTNEKVLYYGIHNGPTTLRKTMMLITDKNRYIIGISEDDKCHEYSDIKCTFSLIKTNVYDGILKEYKNRIVYFGNSNLIAKDNEFRYVKEYTRLTENEK